MPMAGCTWNGTAAVGLFNVYLAVYRYQSVGLHVCAVEHVGCGDVESCWGRR